MHMFIEYATTIRESTMTEREITIRECIRVLEEVRTFPKTFTTWDHGIALHVKEIMVQAVKDYFEVDQARAE